MIGRRAVLGLSLLSALFFCALGAQSAWAVKAENTTIFTCVKGGGAKDFKDAHCDEKVMPNTGEFGHVKVENGKTTEISATNSGVTESTKKSEIARLKSKVGLIETEITCGVVENEPKKSLIHNAQTEVEGKVKHTLTGTILTRFKECPVTKPMKCKVKEPIESMFNLEAVEGLGIAANEMGIELNGEGTEETFAEITYEGAECALKGKTLKVKGSIIGTSGPTTASSQTNHWSGATVVFTPEKEMQKLKLGVETAEFSTIVTPSNAATKTPLAATTCTTTEAKC